MRVRIHRGSKQIGGTCVELESGGERIALDYGLPLDGEASDAALVPQIVGDDLRGVVISHPHLDHYGLLHHLPEGVPVLMGAAARNIVSAAAPFTKQDMPRLQGPTLEHRKTIELGAFKITPYLVDHSAFDSYAVLIEARGKRLFYSGDFRAHGRKSALFESMVAQPPQDIDVLLMEGSSLSRLDDEATFPAETEMEAQMVAAFQATPGLAMVHTSAQNIDRIVSLYRACKKTGRTLVIDLYAAAILEATGNGSIPQSSWPGVALYVPESQRRLIKRNGWFELLDKHKKNRIFADRLHQDPSKYVMLFRPLLMPDLDPCRVSGRCGLHLFAMGRLSGRRLLYRNGRVVEGAGHSDGAHPHLRPCQPRRSQTLCRSARPQGARSHPQLRVGKILEPVCQCDWKGRRGVVDGLRRRGIAGGAWTMLSSELIGSELQVGRWYVGRGRNANIGLWNGDCFLVIGLCGKPVSWKPRKWVNEPCIKREPYFTAEGGCFQPFLLVDAGAASEPIEGRYAKMLLIDGPELPGDA